MNEKVESFITHNYYLLLRISKKITKGHELSQDLLHECIVQLYNKEKIILNNYTDDIIKYYITSIMRINWNSVTSPFYYRMRKESSKYQPIQDIFEYEDEHQLNWEKEMLYQSLEQSYSELDFWSKSMMDLYLVLGSVNKVSKYTNIPKSSIIKYVSQSKQKIKTNTLVKMKHNNK